MMCGMMFGQKVNRIGYVDVDYILSNLEEYKVASEQFEQRVNGWKGEFEQKMKEIDERKAKLEAERALLTAEMIKDRQEEIEVLQKGLDALKEKRFGAEGDYIKQRWQLIQPIQAQIFNIAQEIGKTKKYDYIMTKEEAAQLYADEKADLTKFVLRVLKRKDNVEDRNKDMGTLLKEVYDYDLKSEKDRKREEVRAKREADLAKRKADAAKKKLEAQQKREQKLKEEREAKEKALKAKQEKELKEKQEKEKQGTKN